MADKKQKKPKHTNIVLPGDSKDKNKTSGTPAHHAAAVTTPTPAAPAPANEGAGTASNAPSSQNTSLGSSVNTGKGAPKNGAPTAKAQAPAAQTQAAEEDSLPANAILMPQQTKKRKKKRLTPGKRRRRKKRIQVLLIIALIAASIFVYTSGVYLTAAAMFSDAIENIRIVARPGDGFPMDFSMLGFVKAESMADGFAVLGERDVAFISGSGLPLWRSSHGFVNPGMSTGNRRAVVYSRGGREYSIETRTRTLSKHTTEQDILFCEMSPGGWLLVVTNSRHRSNIAVYNTSYNTADPVMEWTRVDETPVTAAFSGDNRSFVLGCVSANGGSLGTTIHFLRTDKNSVQASVRADGSRLLHIEYTSSNRITAVFDTHTAIYNAKGQELARYDYDGRSLWAADINNGMTALVFGTGIGETLHTVLLNSSLEPLFDVAAEGSGTLKVLAAKNGAFLLAGGQVVAYTSDGQISDTLVLPAKPLTLINSGQPLAIISGKILPLSELLHPLPPEDESRATPAWAKQNSTDNSTYDDNSYNDEDLWGSSAVIDSESDISDEPQEEPQGEDTPEETDPNEHVPDMG